MIFVDIKKFAFFLCPSILFLSCPKSDWSFLNFFFCGVTFGWLSQIAFILPNYDWDLLKNVYIIYWGRVDIIWCRQIFAYPVMWPWIECWMALKIYIGLFWLVEGFTGYIYYVKKWLQVAVSCLSLSICMICIFLN